MKNITIVGSGYVGMSLAALLAKRNNIKVLDIDKDRIELINQNRSTIDDNLIDSYLKQNKLKLEGTTCKNYAYENADFIIICTPTNFDVDKNYFDTTSVEKVIEDINQINPGSFIIIKSTIPLDFTDNLKDKFQTEKIVFSPEFLREGNALLDNLYPSRIIIGGICAKSVDFAKTLKDSAENDPEIIHMTSREAESVKLFANSYLAMRVAFINELDSFALENNLSSKSIIDGISLDPRIGKGYNNPSFGYGGYCLPKDTKQLLANFYNTPQAIISAIVESNKVRKDFIVKKILDQKPKIVGFYRLIMKSGSKNFRSTAVHEIILSLINKGIKVMIYEPDYKSDIYEEIPVTKSLDEFLVKANIIVANRMAKDLEDYKDKIFTRDIYNEN